MNPKLRLPPQSRDYLTSPEVLIKRLTPLLGRVFPLTRKGKTDGAAVRRMISHEIQKYPLPPESKSYSIFPEKGKGLPKNLLEFVDTYIVTSGKNYNLQIWNRIPNSNDPLVECEDGSILSASEVRLILVRIDIDTHVIRSVVGMNPDYIVSKFGKFGNPTIKCQMIISGSQRSMVMSIPGSILFDDDTEKLQSITVKQPIKPKRSFNHWPVDTDEVMSLEVIRDLVANKLVGQYIDPARTKNRGQGLERLILEMLGYEVKEDDNLEGQYPDLKNQFLEIKIQDAPTVDFGKYTPIISQTIHTGFQVTTEDIRYLIVLMDDDTNRVQGVVLLPGVKLGDYFSHVKGVSGKCQRSIPMSFFDTYDGMAVFNP